MIKREARDAVGRPADIEKGKVLKNLSVSAINERPSLYMRFISVIAILFHFPKVSLRGVSHWA